MQLPSFPLPSSSSSSSFSSSFSFRLSPVLSPSVICITGFFMFLFFYRSFKTLISSFSHFFLFSSISRVRCLSFIYIGIFSIRSFSPVISISLPFHSLVSRFFLLFNYISPLYCFVFCLSLVYSFSSSVSLIFTTRFAIPPLIYVSSYSIYHVLSSLHLFTSLSILLFFHHFLIIFIHSPLLSPSFSSLS